MVPASQSGEDPERRVHPRTREPQVGLGTPGTRWGWRSPLAGRRSPAGAHARASLLSSGVPRSRYLRRQRPRGERLPQAVSECKHGRSRSAQKGREPLALWLPDWKWTAMNRLGGRRLGVPQPGQLHLRLREAGWAAQFSWRLSDQLRLGFLVSSV